MELKNYNILVSDGLAQEGVEILKKFKNFEITLKDKTSKKELLEIIEKFDGIIVRSATKITPEVIKAGKKLKVIVRAGTGYDNINIDECNKHGIVVLITPLGNTNAVVELTIGLMLNFARNVYRANSSMREGKWDKKFLRGSELQGKTVGVIGLGNIGAAVVKKCQAFNMNVIAFDRFVPKKRAQDLGIELLDNFNDFLARADYITIHVPLTAQTKDLINDSEIEKMKSTAVIVNVARGGVVNEQALYKALKNNKIGGACIDVYSKEPVDPKDAPFIGLENCITTPHLGANTYEAQIEVAKLAAERIVQALNSKIFVDAVNISFNMSEEMADIYRPYIELGASLSKFITQFNLSKIVSVKIKYKGEIFTNFEPIKAVILQSLFDGRLVEIITYINLEEILKENDIKVVVEKYVKPINYENYIKISIMTEDGTITKIAGTVFSENPRIVEINGLFYDFAPTNYMLALRNNDVPGVIGKIGTFLGNKGINIAGLQCGRKEKGNIAISIITLDEAVSNEALNELKKFPDIINAYGIKL
ncbi:MAG: phosphoglycerate dehydrogenase [Candidatus Lokiarchaeota archaeon]|nr:phosphoglycerate dehydrogenase [Candidatus Lokiarchaeota archaeon]